MSKFCCSCGFVLNLSNGYSSYELKLIPESVIEELAEKLDSSESLSIDHFYDSIDSMGTTVYRCPNCERLYLEKDVNKFISYIREKNIDSGREF